MSGSKILGDEGEEADSEGGYAAEQSRELNGYRTTQNLRLSPDKVLVLQGMKKGYGGS